MSFSLVWRNATIRQCATIPGFVAAAHREQAKFDAADRASSQPVSRLDGDAYMLISYVIEDGGRTTGRQGQGQAWLRQVLPVRAVASGRIRPPES